MRAAHTSTAFRAAVLTALVATASSLPACKPKVDKDGNPITVGRIRLRTFPTGAKVWIDGELKVESTPATLILDPKVYQLKLQLEGAEPTYYKLEVEAGDVDELEIKVPQPEPSTITILSDVEGAKVRINGYTRGYTPLMKARTKPGKIDITVTDPFTKKAKSVGTTLEISEQKVIEVFFRDVASEGEEEPSPEQPEALSRPPPSGFLTLGLKPDGKVLDSDGELIGETPLVNVTHPAGEHELVLESLDGKYRKHITIEVPSGQKAVYRFRFQRLDEVPGWTPPADAGTK